MRNRLIQDIAITRIVIVRVDCIAQTNAKYNIHRFT